MKIILINNFNKFFKLRTKKLLKITSLKTILNNNYCKKLTKKIKKMKYKHFKHYLIQILQLLNFIKNF